MYLFIRRHVFLVLVYQNHGLSSSLQIRFLISARSWEFWLHKLTVEHQIWPKLFPPPLFSSHPECSSTFEQPHFRFFPAMNTTSILDIQAQQTSNLVCLMEQDIRRFNPIFLPDHYLKDTTGADGVVIYGSFPRVIASTPIPMAALPDVFFVKYVPQRPPLFHLGFRMDCPGMEAFFRTNGIWRDCSEGEQASALLVASAHVHNERTIHSRI